MTAAEIINIITEKRKNYTVFGIRGDDRTFSSGEELPCSRNMVDDLLEENEDGILEYPMLDGACATGFGHLWFDGDDEDIDTIEKAIIANRDAYGCEHLYLVAGYDYEYGDDDSEIIIKGAEVICEI